MDLNFKRLVRVESLCFLFVLWTWNSDQGILLCGEGQKRKEGRTTKGAAVALFVLFHIHKKKKRNLRKSSRFHPVFADIFQYVLSIQMWRANMRRTGTKAHERAAAYGRRKGRRKGGLKNPRRMNVEAGAGAPAEAGAGGRNEDFWDGA